jgi:hypothetical protein
MEVTKALDLKATLELLGGANNETQKQTHRAQTPPVVKFWVLLNGEEILDDESRPILEEIIATGKSRECLVVTIPLKVA